MSLTWALVIATCNRQATLMRCLGLAAAQTRLPKEIVIVDASDNLTQTKEMVQKLLQDNNLDLDLQYVAANRKASASQRNQGIALASADVVFLIDDDSMMYPNCAENIMAIYEADTSQQVAAVGATPAALPSDANDEERLQAQSRQLNPLARRWYWLGKTLRSRVLRVTNLFYPYDGSYPALQIPDTVKPLITRRTSTIGGYRLTARREMIAEVKFEELLERYTAGEDLDATYRLSKLGAMVNAADASLCHLQDSSNRFSLYKRTALHAMNIAVLNRLHSDNPNASYRGYRWYLWRRLIAALPTDINACQWSLPQVKGLYFALRHLREVFQKDLDQLCPWYTKFQNQILDGEI